MNKKNISKNKIKSFYSPTDEERFEILIENLPALMDKVLRYLEENNYYGLDFKHDLSLLADAIDELLVLLEG